MESARELKIAEIKNAQRKEALEAWLAACKIEADLVPMPGDASFRRYFRIYHQGQSFVVMDAPPPENVHAFSAISRALHHLGLAVPEILQADLMQGFLLLTDLGDNTYLKTLHESNVNALYTQALENLSLLQTCSHVEGLVIPVFDADFMFKEWDWHKEWFINKLLGLPIEKELDDCYARVVKAAVSQPQVFMHRDFHSANLMVLNKGSTGILDFQDAFFGPITYDVVSLLRDCYIAWPQEQVRNWAAGYAKKLRVLGCLTHTNDEEFLYWFDYMGIQRHLKALLTFARKCVRDHQPHYLQHVQRTLNYLIRVSGEHDELSILHQYLKHTILPAWQKTSVLWGVKI